MQIHTTDEVEGVHVPFQNEKNRQKFFERKIAATCPKSIRHYQWKSVAAFVGSIFEAVSHTQNHPLPKRNLILHGTSDPAKLDQADCLRLVQAISTVLSLREIGDRTSKPVKKLGQAPSVA